MNTYTESASAACRVVAPSSREALRLVRERLGPDAIVLSNSVTADGVEVVATLEETVIGPPAPAWPVRQETAAHPLPVATAASVVPIAPVAHVPDPVRPAPASLSYRPPVRTPSFGPEEDGGSDNVLREIHSMRGMIEEQLAGIAWNKAQRRDPVRGQLLRTLLGAGFSARLARDLLADLPAGQTHASGMAYVKALMASQMPMLESEDALMDEGGVYALMGPTGVGKTTTTAKLAARCVMRFGPEKLALVTTDSYRIGAYEQLRIYGQILGVPVYAVKDAVDLELVLSDLRDKHMVLIDTVGMSQRDRAVSEQIAMLCGASRPVKRLLLLNAASHGDTLNEVVQAYRQGNELTGCIFTKVDEATHPGALIDTVIRHQLPVHYVSSGQKVPEHLSLGQREVLIDSVFQAQSRSAWFVPGEADLAESTATGPGAEVAAEQAVSERLRSQCQQLIRTLAHNAQELTTNAAALSAGQIGFDETRSLWRQLASAQGGTEEMAHALQAQAFAAIPQQCGEHVLVASGELRLAPEADAGAEASMPVSALLSDRSGLPFAAVPFAALQPGQTQQQFGKPAVHLLARLPAPELIRRWHGADVQWAASGTAALRVLAEGSDTPATLAKLLAGLSFGPAQAVLYRNKAAMLSVAELRVRLCADPGDPAAGDVGAASPLRCVVRRLVDAGSGKLLAHSYMLVSTGVRATALQVVQWPAWRIAADAYFKLLHQSALQLGDSSVLGELAAPERLLLAGQACTTVFRLQRVPEGWAETARQVLVQLAGRSARRGRPVPGLALLEGLEKLFVLLDALETDGAAPSPRSDLAPVQD